MRRARRNEEDELPAGYSYIGLWDLDDNVGMAMSGDGVYAYKIIGRVADYNSPANKKMWSDVKAQGRRQLTHQDVLKYFTLPENFYPDTTLVGVGYDGKGYNVYILNEEDIAARTVARRLPSAEDAEYLARYTLADAKKPRMAARIIDHKAMDLQYGRLKKNPYRTRARRNNSDRRYFMLIGPNEGVIYTLPKRNYSPRSLFGPDVYDRLEDIGHGMSPTLQLKEAIATGLYRPDEDDVREVPASVAAEIAKEMCHPDYFSASDAYGEMMGPGYF